MSFSGSTITASLWMILDRARALAESKVGVEHVLGAIIESLPERPCRATKMPAHNQLLWQAGIRWDRATRIRLGIIWPEDRVEAAERAELARLKAKYEGGAA